MIETHHLENNTVIIASGKIHRRMLKAVSKCWWVTGYSVSMYFLRNTYCLQREKITIMEETGRHSLNRDIKKTSRVTRPILICTAKMYNLNLIIRNHQTNTYWGIFYKITGPYSSRLSRSWKTKKKRLRNHYRLKVTKVTGKLNAMWYPWLDPGLEKRVNVTTGKYECLKIRQ